MAVDEDIQISASLGTLLRLCHKCALSAWICHTYGSAFRVFGLKDECYRANARGWGDGVTEGRIYITESNHYPTSVDELHKRRLRRSPISVAILSVRGAILLGFAAVSVIKRAGIDACLSNASIVLEEESKVFLLCSFTAC